MAHSEDSNEPEEKPPKPLKKATRGRQMATVKKSGKSKSKEVKTANGSTSKKRTVISKIQKPKEKHRSDSVQSATLKDLCPQDKAKIGELMKRLASETKEKLELKKQAEEERKRSEARDLHMSREREQMAKKFQSSLRILKELKQSHSSLE